MKAKSNLPMLYGTKTSIVNKDCSKVLGESISIKRPLTFNNAIFQSFAGGNTMIFNLSTKKLITKELNFVHPISHDWWTYLCVSGFGGKVFMIQSLHYFIDSIIKIRWAQINHGVVV